MVSSSHWSGSVLLKSKSFLLNINFPACQLTVFHRHLLYNNPRNIASGGCQWHLLGCTTSLDQKIAFNKIKRSWLLMKHSNNWYWRRVEIATKVYSRKLHIWICILFFWASFYFLSPKVPSPWLSQVCLELKVLQSNSQWTWITSFYVQSK